MRLPRRRIPPAPPVPSTQPKPKPDPEPRHLGDLGRNGVPHSVGRSVKRMVERIAALNQLPTGISKSAPRWVSPMLATLTGEAFSRRGWLFEPKLDGVPCLALRTGGDVQLISRNEKRLNEKYPELVKAFRAQALHSFAVDGEIVAFEGKITSFAKLQQRMQLQHPSEEVRRRVPVYFYAFDFLYLEGRDTRQLPLRERKKLLAAALDFRDPLRFTEHREAEGEGYFHEACRKGWEGIIAKDADSAYISVRSRNWLKFNCLNEQEFVIGGYTDPQGERLGFGALLVGYYQAGKLVYAGKVGTGYDTATLRRLGSQLQKSATARSMPMHCRAAASIGSNPIWWRKLLLGSGRAPGNCDSPAFSVCAPIRLRGKWCGREKMPEREEVIQFSRRQVKITRPEKVLFPEDGITKRDLVHYYRRIAFWIVPHLRARPLTLERYPDGIEETRIIQKSVSAYYPEWIKTVTVKKVGGTVRHVVCDDEATLAYLANQACITPHVWLSRTDQLDFPDQMVFDLDPSGADFALVKATAQSLRKLLEQFHLPAYLKTSGSRGLHVVVPLRRDSNFVSVRDFARRIAEIAVEQDPKHRTLEARKNERRGRVYVDTNRNAYAQTVAPAYSVRARPGAPVSVPLDWHELQKSDLRPDGVIIRTVFARLEKIDDPWKHFWRSAVSLKKVDPQLEKRYAA
jgi:bifunctional non-homologous end joining protein LigD